MTSTLIRLKLNLWRKKMLTEVQKNVAVRLLMGQRHAGIAKEFNLYLMDIANWLKSQEFIDYMDDLSTKNREKLAAYLESKQIPLIHRLEELAEQGESLPVSHKAVESLLGYSGLENRNIAPPLVLHNQANATASATAEGNSDQVKDINDRLKEIDEVLEGKKK